MIESKKGIIDLDKVFSCRNCKNLAFEPIITDCCDIIVCKSCIVLNFKCPKCQILAKFKKSLLLQQIQKNVFVQCPFKCSTTLSYSQLQRHTSMCLEATINCPYCKFTPKIRLIPQHLGEAHIEQCNRMLNQFQRLKEGSKIEVQVKQEPIYQKIQPFKHGTTGQYNIDPRLSRAGRIVCGRSLPQLQLPGQPMVNSSGIFFKNKQHCSVEYGSCDRCMELDVDRLGLPKLYLLNLEGRICCYLVQKRKVACGYSNGSKICNEELQCAHCRRILDLIQRGFYKKCL